MIQESDLGVLFVCLGNICRSPTSEGVFRQRLAESGLVFKVKIDSAGTAGYHIGQPPDSRAITAAAKRGINLKDLRARRISQSDFDTFNYIIAMDHQNHSDLKYFAPTKYSGRICLFMDFAENWKESEIPDPYYGGVHGFERVFDMIDDASAGLINDIKKTYL